MKKILMAGVAVLLGLSANTYAQGRHNFENELRRQRNRIELARRNGAVTPKEYDKLLKEQQAIRNAIHKARRDGYIDAGEAKSIRGKLDRSAHRLRKYRTNNEY